MAGRLVGLTVIATIGLLGCGGGGSGDPDGGAGGPDAATNAPDADPNAPDADPNAPDADPSAPDAATSCNGGQELCGGGCVDLMTNDEYCGNCSTDCTTMGKTCVLGACAAGVAALVLSEVHSMEPSYFELYNGGSSTIDLENYLIQWNSDNASSGSVVLPAYSLAAGAYVVLREASGPASEGVIYLGDDIGWLSAIAVRLLEPGGVGIDFVRTGGSTFDPPAGTSWTGNNAVNPSATVDQSLVRNVFTADTDTAADWTLVARSSPGDYCPAPGRCGDACFDFNSDLDNCGSCGFACGGSQLCVDGECVAGRTEPWISEYRRFPRPMVEIHNPTASPVTMTGYRVDISGADNLSYTFPAFVLEPGAFVAVYAGTGEDDAISLFAGYSRAFDDDVAIALYDDAVTALDFVRFGASAEPAPGAAPWFGNNVPAVSNLADYAARRDLEKLDTDSDADWIAVSPSTPGFACMGAADQCSGECRDTTVDPDACGDCDTVCGDHESCLAGSCESVGKVVISEIRNSSTEAIELYNGTGSPVDLENWVLSWAADNVGSYTIGTGVSIPAGGFIYFYEGSGSSTATQIYTGQTITWNDFIAVTLEDDSAAEIDFVRTGTSVSSGTWTGAQATNPTTSLVRAIYRLDTDSAADWSEASATPASACGTDETVCGESCVDLDTAADHCGRCGNSCGPGGLCHQGACVADGALRMGYALAGDGTYDGRPEMFSGGYWRVTYSTSSSGTQDAWADVVCRQMGYASGSWYSTTRYGTCSGTCGYINSVACDGTEARLADCSYSSGTSLQSGVRVTCNTTP